MGSKETSVIQAVKNIRTAKEKIDLNIDPSLGIILQNLLNATKGLRSKKKSFTTEDLLKVQDLAEKVDNTLHSFKTFKAELTSVVSNGKEDLFASSMPKWVENNISLVMKQLEKAQSLLLAFEMRAPKEYIF